MQEKEYDLFMNVLRNPELSLNNIITGGLNTQNTQLLPKEEYENSSKVKQSVVDDQGQFDQATFDKLYNNAQMYYNVLSSVDTDKVMKDQITYHRDDIFAPAEQRSEGPNFQFTRTNNPYQQTSSIFELGKVGPRSKSVDELAQENKILLNPTTAGNNLENAQWGDSPNDSFFNHFFDTLVLAQYDSDGTHTDLVTGEMVSHKKGDLKTDQNGNFYYEKLDGRDIYGRRVLNKMNILTTDGSFWNKYDFFDSDDINQKSIGGSILKNLALVGTMFIPYVGPWVAGFSIASQLAGLGATLGKMLLGSDSPTLSNIEGWSQSVSRQGAQTEYAQQNTWCWENFINLIGDVAGQLKEQRFIFTKIPYALTGTNIMTEEGRAAKLLALQKEQEKIYNTTIKNLIANNQLDQKALKSISNLNTISALNAQSELNSFIKGYQKLGEVFSKGYMTAITVQDTYGQAKQAGASDIDATLLTLGYAAGEYALLNTGLGEWILPELRASRYKARAIANAVTNVNQETKNLYKQFGTTLKALPKENKKDYVKKLFNIGKNIARAEYSNGSKTLAASLAAGAGEGVEEVSEEILADFSKGCYNVVKWLQGENTRIDTFGYNFDTNHFNINDLVDRYGMSLIGGFVGGGVTNAGTNYTYINNLGNMTPRKAVEEMVYMAREGTLNDFLNQVNKMELGDKNLSMNFQYNDDGTISFLPGTETDNQDVYIKKAINQEANLIQSILQSNNADISDNFLLGKALGDVRFSALYNSTMAGGIINEFNNLCSDIVTLTSKIMGQQQQSLDTNKDGAVSDSEDRHNEITNLDKENIKKYQQQLKEKQAQLKDLLDGKRSYEFVADALFEMTPALSGNLISITYPMFAEQLYGRKFDSLTANEKEEAKKKYDQWKVSDGRDKIKEVSRAFRNISYSISPIIQQNIQNYKDASQELQLLDGLITSIYGISTEQNTDPEKLQQIFQKTVQASLGQVNLVLTSKYGVQEDINTLQSLYQQLSESQTEEQTKEIESNINEVLINNIQKLVQPFIDNGFANTETKEHLLKLLDINSQIISQKFNQWEYINEMQGGLNSFQNKNPYEEQLAQSIQLKNKVSQLDQTPIEKSLNEISTVLGQAPINITDIEQKLNTALYQTANDVSRFSISNDLYNSLTDSIDIIKMYRAAILAARTDAISVNNPYGYNQTLNTVAKTSNEDGYQPLAEIDSQTADMFLADIDTTLTKLQFMKNLYDLNRGQKLSHQTRVENRTNLLIYKRLKSIFSIPDKTDKFKDWEGFTTLQQAIDNMPIHQKFLESGNSTIPSDQAQNFFKEIVTLEDAIYDFFNNESNKKKLDTESIFDFINPLRIQLYTNSNELLNDELKDIDDNSVLWWLASRVAVKASDFYNQYRQVIDPSEKNPIAPIYTQELAVYNNYASIVNGNVYSKFYKAFRQSVLNNWKSLSVQERIQIAKNLQISDDSKELDLLCSDDFAPYALNFLPTPRYQNTILTEGTPGSGKSTAVFKTTIRLLQKTHPQLLENVYVVHGANADSAVTLRDSVGLTDDNSKTFGYNEFMKEVNPEWKEYQQNPTNGKYLIPKSDYTLDSENEIRSSLGIKSTQTPPSLIVIDEISKFNVYDVDQIEKFAKKYGITVIVAGDFDQSGVEGAHSININGKNGYWTMYLQRTNFPRSPKLGVSMRTDNSIKTANIQKMQSIISQYTTTKKVQPITFDYYEDDKGLYGDQVIQYPTEIIREGSNVEISGQKDLVVTSTLNRIDKLISTLKEGEKIGYIYYDDLSPICKQLSSDKYSKYIDFKKGGSAHGLEGQYYIIEADFNSNTLEYLKDIYTGISRSSQGSIIILPSGEDSKMIPMSSQQIYEKSDESISRNSIIKFTENKKSLLDKMFPEGNDIPYIPRNKEQEVNVPVQNPTGGLNPGIDSQAPQDDTPDIRKSELISKLKGANSIEEINNYIKESSIPEQELQSDSEIQQIINDRIALISALQKQQESYNDAKNTIIQQIGNANSANDIENIIQSQVTKFPNIANDQEIIDTKNSRLSYLATIPDKNEQAQYDTATYSDNISPITDTDITPTVHYEQQIDTSNQGTEIPEVSVTQNDNNIDIYMLLHSFNTFETGVLEDENGMPIPVGGKEWMDARIDSINGLIKIDEKLGHKVRSVKDYVNIIGRLRDCIFNTTEKSDLCNKVAQILNLSNIYCTFALKSSPRPSERNKENNREFVDTTPQPFSKGISEKTLFNGSSDIRSHEWHQKSIVMIVGTKEGNSRQDILELPLLALSSPLTIMKTINEKKERIFKEVCDLYDSLSSLSIHDRVVRIIDAFDGNKKYQSLINLFKLYNLTDGAIFYIRDKQWTPSKSLQLLGPQFVVNRGYYQDIDGFDYDNNNSKESEWLTLNEFSHRPDIRITSKVLTSVTGMVDADDSTTLQLVNPGHPFVLVSFNRSLDNDIKIIQQYIKQVSDPTARKEVKLMYVLPPKATLREYIGNIHKILNKQQGIQNIGSIFSSYKLLKVLIKNPDVKSILDRKNPGISEKITEAIKQIDSLTSKEEQKNKLYETEDWSSLGIGTKPTRLAGLFDGVLVSLTYNRNTLSKQIGAEEYNAVDEQSMRLTEAVLSADNINGVYYNPKIPKNNADRIEQFYIPIQGDNYTINDLPFRIHGKIDSYVFKGDMDWLVSYSLDKLSEGNNGHLWSKDSGMYKNRNSSLDFQVSKKQRKADNIVKYLQSKTNQDFSPIYEYNSIDEANKLVVQELNTNLQFQVAFSVNGLMKVSGQSSLLLHQATILSPDKSQDITDISSLLDNNGVAQFVIQCYDYENDTQLEYNAEYNLNTDELSLTPVTTQQTANLNLTISEENFQQYIEAGKVILSDEIEYDPDLRDLLSAPTLQDFYEVINNMESDGSEDRIEIYQDRQNETQDDIQKKILQDLIDIFKYKDTVDENESVCPPTYKIKL